MYLTRFVTGVLFTSFLVFFGLVVKYDGVDNLLRELVQLVAKYFLKSPVHVGGVALARGTLDLDKVQVGNPPGFHNPDAVQWEHLRVTASGYQRPVPLTVEFDGYTIHYETPTKIGALSNLQVLYN
eukprot:EG_transcript_46725